MIKGFYNREADVSVRGETTAQYIWRSLLFPFSVEKSKIKLFKR